MITLTDVYCLYNRARGIDMISPADLRKACELFEARGIRLRLHQFRSGVVVIKRKDDGVQNENDAIVEMLRESGRGVNAAQAAKELGMSVAAARELLKEEERKGKLCRDDSIEGLQFYFNVFPKLSEE
uniref:Vacuolar protein-sorting-associated protein 36 n=1 Tax=Hanusia phi TaxID=3032 RepID=A0A7S0NFE1_9CRYP|mmetsp:Transcript_9256/g.21173  ORF Transcript_9256/g.21173 Transcript_9256/m.21173 type:complete len:128 (+) Transcript_9256:2-385(+)